MSTLNHLKTLSTRIRYNILASTTEAGSGHPTTCLSAVELMTTLFFGGVLRQDVNNPKNIYNDRVIFSKGHAAPLLYSLYEVAGAITQKELLTLRAFNSPLQGHPTPEFPWADVATGSLGQGLSIGVGMSLGIRLKIKNCELKIKREPTVWVLLGDSEMAEGQIWEALEVASYYNLNNLVGILDVNRLGQSGETDLSWDIRTYKKRIESFGWHTVIIENGHNISTIQEVYEKINNLNTIRKQSPTMIIAKTVKGKGISFLEDKQGWHGKTLTAHQFKTACKELGQIDMKIKGIMQKPQIQNSHLRSCYGGQAKFKSENNKIDQLLGKLSKLSRKEKDAISTRKAFGDELVRLGAINPDVVVLDAEVGNSTYTNEFGNRFPHRFFQMFIDEENMVSVALGLSKLGFIPFLSTFAAFLTRAFDQIRMSQYSVAPILTEAVRRKSTMMETASVNETINIVGSHCGVSIGADGPSQMGLEDIAMMRAIHHSTVLYPSDAVSTAALTRLIADNPGINYLRTTRGETPVIYTEHEEFHIGGMKVHYPHINEIPNNKIQITNKLQRTNYKHYKKPRNDVVVIAAGITLHEALQAQCELEKKNIFITVVDLYSIKPVDVNGLRTLLKDTKHLIVVEDHYEAGGIGEAVLRALYDKLQITNKLQKTNYK